MLGSAPLLFVGLLLARGYLTENGMRMGKLYGTSMDLQIHERWHAIVV